MTALEQFFDFLESKGFQISPEDAADALWLTTRLFDEAGIIIPIQRLLEIHSDEEWINISKNKISKEKQGENDQVPVKIDNSSPKGDFTSTTQLYALSFDRGKKIRGHSIPVPTAPILPKMLDMERALRPLSRKKPSKQKWELDEIETVDFIASSGIWNIVKRPAEERWLEGVLIVEQSPTMRLWQEAVREFCHLLWRVGAFSRLETLYLNAFAPNPRLVSVPHSSENRPPLSICRHQSSRVILLFTDCLSDAWLGGEIPNWLASWEKENLTVVMQVLPVSMWRHTSLRNATFVEGSSVKPLTMPRFASGKQNKTPAAKLIPVVSLNPESLGKLSDFLLSSPNNYIACYTNQPADFQEITGMTELAPSHHDQLTIEMAEEAFKRFKDSSSSLTVELARYLAIAPLFLPVMRLIQHNLVPNSEPAHLAELFNSGILYRLTPPSPQENVNQIEYDFLPGIREKLLHQGSVPRISKVQRVLSNYLSKRFGSGADFAAILFNPFSEEEYVTGIGDEAQRPFARVAAMVLRTLGVKYGHAASYLAQTPTTPARASSSNKKKVHNKTILMLEGDEFFAKPVIRWLRESGFSVSLATSLKESITLLQKGHYHLAIIEIRLDTMDTSSRDGMDFLRIRDEYGLRGTMPVIVLTANATTDNILEAFTQYNVFTYIKKQPGYREKLLHEVERAFNEEVQINFNLKYNENSDEMLREVVQDIYWSDRPSPASALLVAEAYDLFGILFRNAESIYLNKLKPGLSGAGLVKAEPYWAGTGIGPARVVKVDRLDKSLTERDHYENFVKNSLPWSTTQVSYEQSQHLGGAIYSFAEDASVAFTEFDDFYRKSNLVDIEESLHGLILKTCRFWYAHTKSQHANLQTLYFKAFSLEKTRLVKAFKELLPDYDPIHPTMRLPEYDLPLTNPLQWLTIHEKQCILAVNMCITHGDMTGRNIMVDGNGKCWLIDFLRTYESHSLRDFVILETDLKYRLGLEMENNKYLEFEKNLIHRGVHDSAGRMPGRWDKEVRKLFSVIMKVRSLARQVGFSVANPSQMDVEYLISLLMATLNVIRLRHIPPERKLQAIHAANLICDELAKKFTLSDI